MSGKITETSKNTNYTAINIGSLFALTDHPTKAGEKEKQGKIFIKDAAGLTGTEISLTALPPKTELPFFHAHKENEEVYIFIKGKGVFQVDDDLFDISEGSIVKVSPKGERSLYNSSDEEMVYLVVQAKENSLTQYTAEDGVLIQREGNWKK